MLKRIFLKTRVKQFYMRVRKKTLYFFIRGFLSQEENLLSGEKINKILAIRIDRIGDLVVSLPALKALRQIFPKAKISILVRQGNDALLGGFDGVDEIIVYRGFIETLEALRQRQFDLAIDLLMDYTLKTALLAYLSKAKFIAGFDIEGRGYFFNLKLRPLPEKKHISQHTLDLVKMIAKSYSVDIPFDSLYPEIPIPKQNEDYIKSFLKEKAIQEEDFLVGIHPGGHYPSQLWPIERFSQLADRIIQRYKTKVVVVGSQDEKELIEKMLGLMKEKAIKFIGLPLDKLTSLISSMDIFIGNNSGPLHIACALNSPTISTMGPTDPDLWWPQGKGHLVIRYDLPCSPCNLGFCRNHKCMRLIAVEEMEKAVEVQMEKIGRKAEV